jgi:hypothetical protein
LHGVVFDILRARTAGEPPVPPLSVAITKLTVPHTVDDIVGPIDFDPFAIVPGKMGYPPM